MSRPDPRFSTDGRNSVKNEGNDDDGAAQKGLGRRDFKENDQCPEGRQDGAQEADHGDLGRWDVPVGRLGQHAAQGAVKRPMIPMMR